MIGFVSRAIDKVIVREVQSTYAQMPVQSGDVVLDLGANIGASARMLLEKGAAKVIAIEPDPSSVLLAKRNLARYPAEVIWAAVGAAGGKTKLYVSRKKPYLTSLISDTDRVPVPVTMLSFGGLLERYRPTIVKCDIEFGEYDLDWTLPDFVRVVALEVHIRYDLVFKTRRQTDGELRKQRRAAAFLMDTITDQGFRLVTAKTKVAQTRPIEDKTGLDPFAKSVDAIWTR